MFSDKKLQTIEQARPGVTYTLNKADWMDAILDFIEKTIGHLVTLAGGAFGMHFVKKLMQAKEDSTKTMQWNIDNLAQLHRAMDKVLANTSADRFLILKGSNGGGVPKPGSPYFVSVIHAVRKDGDSNNLVESYQNLLVDLHYLEMLSDILLKGSVTFKVSKMPKGLLQRIYQSEGVTSSTVFSIAKSETELFFGIIATHRPDGDLLAPSEVLPIELGINEIRNVFGKYRKG